MSKLNKELEDLIATFRSLRNPDTGCAWDREQTFKSIASCAIEEAYEVADAIDREDFKALKSELGDLLFQVIFHAEMANEKGIFDFKEVISMFLQMSKQFHRKKACRFGRISKQKREKLRN